jgi:hypothetical protein
VQAAWANSRENFVESYRAYVEDLIADARTGADEID